MFLKIDLKNTKSINKKLNSIRIIINKIIFFKFY